MYRHNILFQTVSKKDFKKLEGSHVHSPYCLYATSFGNLFETFDKQNNQACKLVLFAFKKY